MARAVAARGRSGAAVAAHMVGSSSRACAFFFQQASLPVLEPAMMPNPISVELNPTGTRTVGGADFELAVMWCVLD